MANPLDKYLDNLDKKAHYGARRLIRNFPSIERHVDNLNPTYPFTMSFSRTNDGHPVYMNLKFPMYVGQCGLTDPPTGIWTNILFGGWNGEGYNPGYILDYEGANYNPADFSVSRVLDGVTPDFKFKDYGVGNNNYPDRRLVFPIDGCYSIKIDRDGASVNAISWSSVGYFTLQILHNNNIIYNKTLYAVWGGSDSLGTLWKYFVPRYIRLVVHAKAGDELNIKVLSDGFSTDPYAILSVNWNEGPVNIALLEPLNSGDIP